MRRRIISLVIGGLAGVCVSAPVNDYFKMAETFGILACAVAGIVLGCMVSMLMDVFVPHNTSEPAE
jgi:hypothetical protein